MILKMGMISSKGTQRRGDEVGREPTYPLIVQ